MLRPRRIAPLLAALLLCMGAAEALAQPHGATHGVASVNAAGGATYTIPIWCPAGPAGLTPQIALTYSSLGGTNIAGRGWSLAGVSAISRAPRTVLHDGAAQGIDLSPDDAWAWDGQRLLPLPNQPGHYRTEIESHTQITAELSGDGQPTAFSVRTRDGHTLRYAQPLYAHGCWHKPVSLHLTEHLHPDGWRIHYTYAAEAGELLLSRIAYGPYAIALGYEQRPDRIEAYIAGYELFIRHRLRSITVTGSDGSALRTYALSYAQGHDGGSELQGIAEAGSDGKPLKPITFSMRPGGSMRHEELKDGQENWHADLDGDGRDDIVRLTADGNNPRFMQRSWSVYLSSSGTWRDMGALDHEQQLPVLADRDGDGLPEVYINRTHRAHVGWDCDGYAPGCNAPKPIGPIEVELGVDAPALDGLEPSSIQIPDTSRITLIPQPGLDPAPGHPDDPRPPAGCCSWKPRYQEQHTAMGYAVRGGQLVCTGEIWEHVTAQTPATMGAGRVRNNSVSLAQSEYRDVHVADLNADGLDDIIIIHKSSHENKGNAWSVHLNQGDGTFAQHGSNRSLSGSFRQLQIADINGDGLMDVYLQHKGTDQVCMKRGRECWDNPEYPTREQAWDDTLALTVTPWWNVQPWDTSMAGNLEKLPITPIEDPGDECCMWYTYSNQQLLAYINDGRGNLSRADEYDRTFSRLNDDDQIILVDLDGNGRTDDYIVLRNVKVKVDKKEVDRVSLIQTNKGSIPGDTQELNYVTIVDYNGDGRTDILLTKGYSSTAYSYLPRRGFVPVYTGYPTEWHRLFKGDFNGDGKTDFLTQCEGKWAMSFAKGGPPEDADAGCFKWPHFEGLPFSTSHIDEGLVNITVADFNGDGLDDVLQRVVASKDATTATFKLYLSNGRGNFTLANSWTHNFGITVYKDHTEKRKRKADESWLKWLFNHKQTVVDHNAGHAIGRFHSRGQAGVYIYHGAPSARQELRTPTHGEQRGLLRSITDGLGRTTTFAYEHLSAPGMHTRGSGSSWPMVDAALNHLAVRQMDDDDGVLGRCATTYTYSGAMVHAQGRGFLGFREMRAQSRRGTNITRLAPLAARGMAVGAGGEVLAPNGTILSRNTLTYTAVSATDRTKGFGLLLTNAVQTDGATDISTSTSTTYDANGDPIRTHSSTNGLSTTVERSFDAVGRVLSQTSTTTRNGAAPHAQTASYTYDDKGHLLTATTERGTARYAYDARGLLTAATDVEGRTSRYTYNAYGQVLTATDPLGRSMSYAYGAAGEMRSSTDAVGTSTYTYDALGRQISASTPFGSSSTAVSAATSGAPSKAVTTVTSTADGQPKRTTHLDAAGRLLRTEEQREGGRVITSEPTYNALGQVTSDILPRYANEPARRSTVAYDAYGRITSSTDPFGRRTAYSYSGLSTTTTDPAGHTTTQVRAADGLMLSSTDVGGTVSISYSSAGLPLRIEAHGMATTIEYDALLRRTAINDPSAGRTTFAYDGLSDRLARRTDARGLSTTYAYDQHGRLTSEASPDGTFTYTYMSAGPALGQLQRVEGNGATWAYAYDQRGLLAQEQMGMDGQTLRAAYQYDALGRTSTRTYPSGYAVRYAYSTTDGELTRIESTDGQPLWRRGKEDALGRPLSEQIGGLERTHTYDAMGHLTALSQGGISRRYAYDAATGSITRREANGPLLGSTVEQFAYDAQDRLSGINGQPIRYDALGNIAQMPGVGAMQHAGYQLNALTAQVGFAKPEVEIEYAANGRARQLGMCIQQSGLGLGLSFEEQSLRPTLPTEQGIMSAKDLILKPRDPIPSDEDPIMPIPPDKRPWWSTETHRMNITHGPGGVRLRSVEESSFFMEHATAHRYGSYIKEVVTQKRSATVRYYTADAEREISNGTTTDLTYITSPTGLVAAIKTTGTQHDAMLIATDHLCSIVGVWDAQGTLLEEHRYSAWGQRTSSTNKPRLRRGFTGHEHLQQFGLIDMQARLYDPHLGRFLAPDPYVQAPEMSMNFNRYAYCMNNPLKYVDPMGEFCIGAAIFIGGFINFAIQGITDNIHSFGDCVKAWTIGGLSGLAGAAAGAAVAGAISIGGFAGGALVGAAGGAASGFVNGAGNALFEGEKFGEIMKQGAIGAGIGGLSGGLIGGVAGGIEAAMDGRNFWHGGRVVDQASMDLPKMRQSPDTDDCRYETFRSIDEYYNGETSSVEELRSKFPDLEHEKSFAKIQKMYNSKKMYFKSLDINEEMSKTDIAERLIKAMNQNEPVYYEMRITKSAGHAVAVRNVTIYDNGRITIKLMNPSGAGGYRIHNFKRMLHLYKVARL